MPYRNTKFSPIVPYHNQIITGKKTIVADTAGYEDEILLPTCPEGMLPAFLKIEVERASGSDKALNAAYDYSKWSISPKSQDDVLDISDPDCIACGHLESAGTSVATVSNIVEYNFPAPQLISYKKLYIQFKDKLSTEMRYRIHWVPRPSSIPQRDNLVSQLQF